MFKDEEQSWSLYRENNIFVNSRVLIEHRINMDDDGSEASVSCQILNESIISLLLKLHKKLTAGKFCYRIGVMPKNATVPLFTNLIGKILDLFVESNNACAENIIGLVKELTPIEAMV